jgi:predicted dehydrogenase
VRAAIVGCGLIGRKRTVSLPPRTVTVCCDTQASRAEHLAATAGAEASTDWQSTVRRDDIGVVFIVTTHDQLAPIPCEAAAAGKHVLVEKPGQRTRRGGGCRRTGALVRVGFNSIHKNRVALDARVSLGR